MKKIERILAPTDFSPNAHLALTQALELAAQLQARLDILTVKSSSYIRQAIQEGLLTEEDTDETLQARTTALTEERLNTLVASLDCQDVAIETHILTGDPGHEIVHFATEAGADLIVMGTHGISGVRNILFGSSTEKVIRRAPCPVLVVRLPDATE